MPVYSNNLKIKHCTIIYRGVQTKCGRQVKKVLGPNTRPSSCSSTISVHSRSRLSRDPLVHSDVLRFTENRNRKQETVPLDRALAQAVSLWRLTTDTQVRSHASPCEISGGQRGSRTGFSPSTSVFPFRYHSTNAPHSYLSTYSSYQKEKRAKPENLPQKQCSFENRAAL
jgi:hypothetical protein